MRSLLKDKRGGFTDLFLFIIIAFIIALISGMFIYMGSTVKDELLGSKIANKSWVGGQNYSDVFEDNMGDLATSYNSLKWISYFLIMGMVIAIMIGSFLVTTRPVFFVPYLIIVIMAVVMSMGIANGYELLIDKTTPAQASFQSLAGTNYILLNLPLVVTVVGIIGGIVMFISFKKSQDNFI